MKKLDSHISKYERAVLNSSVVAQRSFNQCRRQSQRIELWRRRRTHRMLAFFGLTFEFPLCVPLVSTGGGCGGTPAHGEAFPTVGKACLHLWLFGLAIRLAFAVVCPPGLERFSIGVNEEK